MAPNGNRTPSTTAVCTGSEIEGSPAMFAIEVQGVKRFWSSKSAAGSASSRSDPTAPAARRGSV